MEHELINTLSRLQFAVSASYHIIFPSLLIGLSTLLSFLYGRWLYTKKQVYLDNYELWLKFLVVIYFSAAITGVALSAQLDNIFGGFYTQVGAALLPIRQIELVLAIILEGGCIGVMIFYARGKRSSGRFSATLLFNAGIFLTAFFVISRNSWMNTPSGVEWVDGYAVALNYWEILFNPSFPLRYAHMMVAGLMATSFVVMGLSAYRLLRLKEGHEMNSMSFRIAFKAALVLTPCQFIVGDLHGLDVYQHQPLKIASMEGHWDTARGADLIIWARPNQEMERNDNEIVIPSALSLILTHSGNGEVLGIKELARDERPNISLAFYAFRIMIALAIVMLIFILSGVYKGKKAPLETQRGFLQASLWVAPAGLMAIIAGWIVAETARQPWTVYAVIKTSDTLSAQTSEQVINSIILLSLLYFVLSICIILILKKTLLSDGLSAGVAKG